MRRTLALGILCCLYGTLSAQSYASNSVLQSGTWYKLGVVEAGVYRLDQAFFSQLGLNPANIDPRQIQLYGNGGRLLPQPNQAFRHDDLVENPIFVAGEADGNFGENDHVLFYGEGPHTWEYGSETQGFRHRFHAYADTNYYFLRIGPANGKRLSEIPPAPSPNFVATQGQQLYFHEVDRENLIKSGRVWLGEKFDLTTERRFAFAMPDARSNGQIRINLMVAARSDVLSHFRVRVNNQEVGSVSLPSTNVANSEARHYWRREGNFSISTSEISSDDSLHLSLIYDKNGSSRGEGWLDWVEVSYDQVPDMGQAPSYRFNLTDSQIGPGQVASLSLSNGSNAYRVWDITNPVEVQQLGYTLSGSTLELSLRADSVKRLLAFREASLSPVSWEFVSNQDLHGLSLVDYLIISPEAFIPEAERLANFHRQHFQRSVEIVTPAQIYNEFSSGKQDVSAIRDFIRMLYVRSSGLAPGFVLFFGDGSYVYKNISQNVRQLPNSIPTYQSRDSWDPTSSYTSDDFFVMLEPHEGFWGEGSGFNDPTVQLHTLDVPIGRLPVETLEQGTEIVDKIIGYVRSAEENAFGTWRNRIVLVADHKEGEGNTHVRQANGYTGLINTADPCINLDKIYMDNYTMVTTAGVTRFPNGRKALLEAFDQGALIVNYTGHGGEQAWSNSRIFENPDIPNMKNTHRLPAVVTATCEYGRYDDPDKRTGAEIMLMTPEIGAIAMFTTVRLVYSSPNETLNRKFYNHAFTFDSLKGRKLTIGEIMMRTKNSTFPLGNLTNINSRNFTLLGDPGLILNYPNLRARITEINGSLADPGNLDSLRSLSLAQVKGVIENTYGQPQSQYNGDLDITVFDKPSRFTTRLSNYSFSWQKNRIFNGTATVQGGAFSFDFVVPIDVSYENGTGKISLYFANDTVDGSGCYYNLYVGGTDPNVVPDEAGPEVRLFMNDSNFVAGGITGPNPFLFAEVFDESGINTVGSGIGHEITAVLDENEAQVIILNDYYTATRNDYRSGTVRYQLQDLELGQHKLRIRVWDVANNVAEAETHFWVADDAKVVLDQILNYPNPFQDETQFMIGHNQAGKALRVSVDIFTADGRLVKALAADFVANSSNYRGLSWDGRNDAGQALVSGMYVYRVTLTEVESGKQEQVVKRLVLLR